MFLLYRIFIYQPHNMIKHLTGKGLSFIILLACTTSAFAQSADAPLVKQGAIDLRHWDFKESNIALAGTWAFYPNQLIEKPEDNYGNFAKFPDTFENISSAPIQTATFTTTVLLPAMKDSLAISIPQLYCSYALYVNGNKIAENGKAGTTKESTTPQWLPQVTLLGVPSDTLTLALQIANFYHDTGGIKENLHIGLASRLNRHHAISKKSTLAECCVLLILGLGFFVIYYVRQEKKKISLYFSLLCLSWAVRVVFSGNYLFIEYFPDFDWTWMVRIEYITLFSIQIWAAVFFTRLFPNESNRIAQYALIGFNTLFLITTLVTEPLFFTQWILVYLTVIGLLLVYGLITTLRALLNARTGVWYLVFSLVMALALFSYEVFVYKGFFQEYNPILFSVGYSIVFILTGIALSYHLNIFKSESSGTLTFEELYKN